MKMLKVRVMSDLHWEFHKDSGRSFVESVPSGPDEVLVLAGDVTTIPHLLNSYPTDAALRALCSKFRQVLWTLGNHEYHNGDTKTADAYLDALVSTIPNLKILRPGKVEVVDSQRFIGATLWFSDSPDNRYYSQGMSDFSVIKNFMPWVYQQNEAAINFFGREMREGDVVVTHHLPSYSLVAPQFRASSLNRFFVCPLGELIAQRKPKLFAYGHTHYSHDHMVASTRTIVNAFGYPHEASVSTFNDNLVIEV